MKMKRQNFLAFAWLFFYFTLLFMPLEAYAAKEGDYVDPVEYYDLKRFAGNQLTAYTDIRLAILEKEYLPVELVLKPIGISSSAVHLAHANSGDRTPLENYEILQGEPLILKNNEKCTYELHHEVSNTGTYNQSDQRVFPTDYNYKWQGSIHITFDDLLYSIVDSSWEDKAFYISYQSTGTANSIGSCEHFDPSESRDVVFTSDYKFNLSEKNKKIIWHIDKAGIMTVRISSRTSPGNYLEEWRYENPTEINSDNDGAPGAIVVFQVEQVKLGKANSKTAGATKTIDSKAAKDAGETGVTIPLALATVIIGGLGALAAAGAGGNSLEDNKENEKSSYKMCLRKDFGDAIRYDSQPVTVYARIVEESPEGEEIDRPDLTAAIDIFSGGGLKVESTAMADNYMGALVCAESVPGGQNPDTGILSLRLSSEGGSFQNNVSFRLLGDPYISLAGPNLSILVGSGEKFTLPLEFIDFIEDPQNIVLDGDPLAISLIEDEGGNYYIEVTDDEQKPEKIDHFYEEIPYTISADSGEELVQARFSVLKCYEGILPDYLGKTNEIMAYKNEEGEMPITDIAFQMGIWDKEGQELNLLAPESMELSYEDPEGIYELIGLSFKEDVEATTSSRAIYSFTADKSLPSANKIEGTLSYSGKIGDLVLENETTIFLLPDILSYYKDLAKEFKNCEYIIETYMSGDLKKRKLDQLYKSKDKMGIKDLQLFKKKCWETAMLMIFQEKEDYLQESYWYDQRIAELELAAAVGDIALDAALAPLGGPITVFIIGQAKDTFLELCEIYVNEGNIFTWDTLSDLIWNRFQDTIGSVDNFIGMPEDASWKVKAAWLSSFFLYRVFYHWFFDEDDDGNSLGLVAALESAVMDLAIERISTFLGDYVSEISKKEGVDLSKKIASEEELVEKTLVGAFDMADKVADSLDQAVLTIIDFIKSIQLA